MVSRANPKGPDVNDLQDRLGRALPIIRDGAADADTDAKFPAESVAALADTGLLGLTLPTEVGGLGGGPREVVEAVSEVAAACGSTSMIYLMHLSSAMVVAAAPPAEGSAELLAGMASGSTLGTLAFSEKGSRSHFWAPVSELDAPARRSFLTLYREGGTLRVPTIEYDGRTVWGLTYSIVQNFLELMGDVAYRPPARS